MSLQKQKIINQMMSDPPTCYTVFVEFVDGVTKFYTFSSEEGQIEFTEYLEVSDTQREIWRVILGESLVDHRGDTEDWLFTIH